jgi:nitrite reductase/ring-hydroxylating ferredoxin subunit
MLTVDFRVERAFSGARGPRNKTARHNWWPVAFSRDVQAQPRKPKAVTLFGEPLVLFTNVDGHVECVADVCAHSSAALSQGFVEGGELVCRYHGWRYTKGGTCAYPRELAGKRGTTLYSYRVVDDGHLIWVYPSHDEPVEFVNPLFEFTRRAGVNVNGFQSREFTFHQRWELWQASFIDSKHRDFAHPKTILQSQQATTEEFFDVGITPAATAVNAKHDRVLGLFTYLTFSPEEEHRHRQFLTIMPVSDILPPRVAYRLFAALRIPKIIAAIAYEDYFLIYKQAERVRQGASKWGIRGKYGCSDAAERFIEWHLAAEKEPVWFAGYGEGGKPHFRREKGDNPLKMQSQVEDSGLDLGPYQNGDHTLAEPHTWRRLKLYDQAVKALASWVAR